METEENPDVNECSSHHVDFTVGSNYLMVPGEDCISNMGCDNADYTLEMEMMIPDVTD